LNGHDPDSELLTRIGRGDERAVREIVAARLPGVLALATRLLGDRMEAEDVAQEVFVRVWRHAARWQRGRAMFGTWLHVVTLNLCRDRLRRRRVIMPPQLPDVPDPAPLSDEALEEAEAASAVSAAITALPGRQREAILLVHYQDMTNIAAAEAMEISVEALESLLARGRRALRRALVPGAEKEKSDE
jgi:RNA polymerase sigma-70 factor (ECF subfamily)